MLVIGICGDATIGKTTLAQMLESRLTPAKICPFAGPLKQAALDLGWNGKKDAKGRKLLQLLGTDVGRNCISETIWEDKWRKQIGEQARDGIEYMIADDVRFPNELALIKEVGGVVIKVKKRSIFRPIKRLIMRLFGRLHASEIGFKDKDVDIIVVNNGTKGDLDDKSALVAKELNDRI